MTALEGALLRDQGVLDVLAADTAPHRGAGVFIREAVEAFAEMGDEFTAEDVREALRDNPRVTAEMDRRPNLLPSVMRAAALQGLVRQVDWTTATRPEAHARALRVWKGQP